MYCYVSAVRVFHGFPIEDSKQDAKSSISDG